MCKVCGGKGYIDTPYSTIIKVGRSTEEDFKWREEACNCKIGEEWLARQVGVGWNMARRINEFIDSNLGIRKNGNNNYMTRNELADVYVSGKRYYDDNGEIDWRKI